MFDQYIKQSFILVMLISGVPLLVSCIVGLVISVLQAATQIQEQSISYFAKFISVSLVIAISAGWFSSELVGFMQTLFASITYIGRS